MTWHPIAMSRAILHIGTEKTGTTAIQHHFAANRATLDATGFHYAEAPGHANHIRLAAYAQADGKIDDLRMAFGVTDALSLARFRAALEDALAAEVARYRHATFVFSGEHCHSRLQSAGEVERLKLLLDRHFDTIDVIVYLRRQDEMAVSLYSTMLKAGGTREQILTPEMTSQGYFDHRGLLDRWTSVFGRSRMIVARFAPDALIGGSIIPDFCARSGMPLLGRAEARANDSLRPAHQEFLRRFNAHVPRFIDGRLNMQRGPIEDAMTAIGAGRGRRPSAVDARAFYAHFRGGNEAVRAAWFPSRTTLFDEDFAALPPVEDPGDLTLDQAIDIAADLWKSLALGDRALAAAPSDPATASSPALPQDRTLMLLATPTTAIGGEQGAVNSGYQRDDIDILDYRLWQFDGQSLRGPAPALDQPYFSALGAAQVFGRFVPHAFPALVGEMIGLPAMNLGMSGAGPSFFLRRPAMIEAVNNGQFAIVQMMSGRSVSNSRIAIGYNQGVGRLRAQPDAPLRFAEQLYHEALAALSPSELSTLRAELRDHYVSEMSRLLDKITVPKILLYWSQRAPEYDENVTDLAGYWGDFPHFVNREVIDALRPHADDYVEVVTSRGIPQPLFSAATGEPVLMWSEEKFPNVQQRFHNHYYPSPEMNRDVADALIPAAARGLRAVPTPPPPSREPRRHVLMHAHIFKNAGSAIDRSLREVFRGGWDMIDPPSIERAFTAEDITRELLQRPELRAVSSHQVRFPLDEHEGFCLYPIVMLRDPILRAQSIYEYERMAGRRETSNAMHTVQANKLDFPDWISWCLEFPGSAGPIANYQTRMCSITRNGRIPEDWDAWVDITQYREAIHQLQTCHVGKVETISRSLFDIETALQPIFPELQLLPYIENASREEGIRTVRSRANVEAELGPALYARLCEANAWDLLLVDRF